MYLGARVLMARKTKYSKFPQWYVKSASSKKGKEYKVTHDTDKDEWLCSCPGWINYRPVDGCKHIKSVKQTMTKKTKTNTILPTGIRLVPDSDLDRKEVDLRERVGAKGMANMKGLKGLRKLGR